MTKLLIRSPGGICMLHSWQQSSWVSTCSLNKGKAILFGSRVFHLSPICRRTVVRIFSGTFLAADEYVCYNHTLAEQLEIWCVDSMHVLRTPQSMYKIIKQLSELHSCWHQLQQLVQHSSAHITCCRELVSQQIGSGYPPRHYLLYTVKTEMLL